MTNITFSRNATGDSYGKTPHRAATTQPRILLPLLLWFGWLAGTCPGEVPVPVSHKLLNDIDLNGVLEDFDGVRPSLEIIDDSSLAVIKAHARTDRAPMRGRRSEYLLVWGKRGGEKILAAQPIVPVAAISELEVSCWVRGNRPGYQIMLRVRLPRALDNAGQPLSVYLLGDRYRDVGSWQQLRVADFDTQFAERIRAMRAELQRPINAREAYVDRVVFNIFGGAGENRVWIDDLAVLAGVPIRTHDPMETNAPTDHHTQPADWRNRVPRVAIYRGQPLADVARQGFNGIEFRQPPTPQQIEAAQKHRLQIVMAPETSSPQDPPPVAKTSPWIRHTPSSQSAKIQPVSWAVNFAKDDESHDNPTTSRQGWIDLNHAEVDRWLPLREKIREAVFSGAQGFLFDPVHFSSDHGYQQAIAELANLELEILRPWILRRASTERIIHQSDSSFAYMGMFGQHAGILWVPRDDEKPYASIGSPTIDVPVAHIRQAHFLTPGSVSPTDSRRIPGGIRIQLHRNNPHGFILLTNHPKVLKEYARQMALVRDRYQELFVRVIRVELLRLDQELSQDARDPQQVAHLRQEVHALHNRIAPVLERSDRPIDYRQLDHFLGQLERVHHSLAL